VSTISGHRPSPPGSKGTHELRGMPRVPAIRNVATSSSTENRKLVVEVLDQGGLGSCELNAAAQALRIEQVLQATNALMVDSSETSLGLTFEQALAEVKKAPPPLASRLFWYLASQACGGYLGQGDTGTCSCDVASAAANVGIVREGEYPYSDDESRIDPGTKLEALKRLAWDNRCSAVARVDADDMTPAEAQNAFSAALRSQYAIVYATDVTERFTNLMPGEVWQGPSDGSRNRGGHAFTIVDEGPAYALSKHSSSAELCYLVLNSWGQWWCEGGFCLMSQSAVSYRYDGYIISTAPEVL
jgi:hypothetical protein